MSVSKITFENKTDKYTVSDRTKQVCAADMNEIKSVVNNNAVETSGKYAKPSTNKGSDLDMDSLRTLMQLGFSFEGFKFDSIIFSYSTLDTADLNDLFFNGSEIVDCSFSQIELTGSQFQKCTIENCAFNQVTFGGADFTGSSVSGLSFDSSCIFNGANFTDVTGFSSSNINEVFTDTYTDGDTIVWIDGETWEYDATNALWTAISDGSDYYY